MTHSHFRILSIKRFVLVIFIYSILHVPVARGDEVVVAAAASLTNALTEIGNLYSSKTNNKIIFTFGASSILARQVHEGAPVDLFFSADPAKVNWLAQNRRIKSGSRIDLLSNQLVMIVPRNSAIAISSVVDLLQPKIKKIGIGEPSTVPAGIYARKFLEMEGIWERISPKVIPLANVRATLATVGWGNVDVGFVYKTDTAISQEVKIVYQVPREKTPDITYSAVLVKESKNLAYARDFLKFISSNTARKLFEMHGFIILQ